MPSLPSQHHLHHAIRRIQLLLLVAIVAAPAGAMAAISISTQTVPKGTVGSAYEANFQASGAVGTTIWTTNPLELPKGVVLSPSGRLSGTPLEARSHTFTIRVVDSRGLLSGGPQTTTKAFTLDISGLDPEPESSPRQILPFARKGKTYSHKLESASTGVWAKSAGDLPNGVLLSPNGQLLGIPLELGTFEFSATRTGLSLNSESFDYSIHVISDDTLLATAGVPTGLATIGKLEERASAKLTIDWGDGTMSEGLLRCEFEGFKEVCYVMGRHTYSKTGEFAVSVTGGGTTLLESSTIVSPIDDFVILSIGDSIASGEGNPDVKANFNLLSPAFLNPPFWDDDAAHRSSKSGHALAAETIQQLMPDKEVTFIHLAKTGANIADLEAQLVQAKAILGDHSIAALFVTAGANNIAGGFSSVVSGCLGYSSADDVPDPTVDCSKPGYQREGDDKPFVDEIRDSLGLLNADADTKGSYAWLDQKVAEHLNVSDVYLTEYFDPTRDEKGEFPASICTASLMLKSEWEFLHDEMVVGLNSTVSEVVESLNSSNSPHTWHLADGIAEATKSNGYCAPYNKSSVIKLEESLISQRNLNGTAHPNEKGHLVYRDALVKAVLPGATIPDLPTGLPDFGKWLKDQGESPLPVPQGDLNGDGIPDLLNFALGKKLDISKTELAGLLPSPSHDDLTRKLAFDFTLPEELPPGMNVIVEQSLDGFSWQEIAIREAGSPWELRTPLELKILPQREGLEKITLKFTQLIDKAKAVLLRLNLSFDSE